MSLKILFCASEAIPFAKTGGLADVAASLPEALSAQGCDVRLFLPLYPSVERTPDALKVVAEWIPISVGVHTYHVHFWQWLGPSPYPVYFMEKDEFFHRPHLYVHPLRGDYEDNAERFITFSRSLYALCKHLDWIPHIVHLHDWQTACAAAYHYFHWRYDAAFSRVRTLLTIHNLAHQGLFPESYFGLTGLPLEAYTIEGMEFFGQCNFLKAGIAYSDRISTVSPKYAREILDPKQGFGLDGLLRRRRNDLIGILNGIDTTRWNPSHDPYIPAPFDAEQLDGKRVCKEKVLEELEFPASVRQDPLCVVVSRLVHQKGIDLILEALDDMMELSVCLAVLGTGDPHLERLLLQAQSRHSDRIRVVLDFDEALAHRLEAGADIFLMPSRYEPCGLNQMYSMRYGTIPIVTATGGLDDSVVDAAQNPQMGTGFKFYEHTKEAFLEALKAALEAYRDSETWRRLRQRAMREDFSWPRAARSYMALYEEMLGD
ncbi:glycogen synthase GlgA [Desulfosoma caldarium]|uniref:Glycogen synthase n=1 Tax=Desulfosoma caldarium TaxID=610254 RepID=A0A3N1UXP4_9BACT|nr:glycogen synthase GlgA [Desulfosoma caldarium]ROQ93307.1 glycogen synthase (ADP-glucose) [Desulfosoma caldarium]